MFTDLTHFDCWKHCSFSLIFSGLDAAQRLGIEPIFTAQEIADPQVEHLGVMAYAAYFTKMKPVKISNPRASFTGNFDSVHVNNEVWILTGLMG